MSRATDVAELLQEHGPLTVNRIMELCPQWDRDQALEAVRGARRNGLIRSVVAGSRGPHGQRTVWGLIPEPMPAVSVFDQGRKDWPGMTLRGQVYAPLGGWE